MLHLRMIYDEILKNSVFASSRPGRTDARVIGLQKKLPMKS